MQTERLILDPVTESDRQDYFTNISHDRKVLETFVCRYAETPEEVDLTKIIGNPDVFAVRLKQTGRLIGLILFFGARAEFVGSYQCLQNAQIFVPRFNILMLMKSVSIFETSLNNYCSKIILC